MKLSELTFHVPPECAGQIVEISYCRTPEQIFKRVCDRGSPTSPQYYVSTPLVSDEGDYWNGAPENRRWREIVPAVLATWPIDE